MLVKHNFLHYLIYVLSNQLWIKLKRLNYVSFIFLNIRSLRDLHVINHLLHEHFKDLIHYFVILFFRLTELHYSICLQWVCILKDFIRNLFFSERLKLYWKLNFKFLLDLLFRLGRRQKNDIVKINNLFYRFFMF